jgi:DNA-binding transcriptional LysR family regulator
MEWDDLKFFLAVSRCGGLTGAAEKLKVSPSTVSRRLVALEERISATLFVHHQTGYMLTEEGRLLVVHAERVEESVLELERAVANRDREPVGHVKLATAENIANFIIIPALAALHKRYPRITLEIVTGISSVNLAKQEADIALRLTRPESGNINVKKLGVQNFGLYASKDYLAEIRRRGIEPDTDSLDIITWAEGFSNLPMAAWARTFLAGREPRLQTSSLFAQLVAARAGIGAALLPCFMAEPDPSLERLGVDRGVVAQDLWLVIHRDLAGSAKVRACADFLEQLVVSHRALFEGAKSASKNW